MRPRPLPRQAPARPRHGRDHRAQEASHRVRRRSAVRHAAVPPTKRRRSSNVSTRSGVGDGQHLVLLLFGEARAARLSTHETRVSRSVQRLGPGSERVKEGHTCTNAQQTDLAAGQRRQGAHPAQAAGGGDAARAPRPHALGCRSGADCRRVAGDGLSLLPQPQHGDRRRRRREPGPGAQLPAQGARWRAARARAVPADLPALQGVRAAHARRPAALARARIAGARRPARGTALSARLPTRPAAPGGGAVAPATGSPPLRPAHEGAVHRLRHRALCRAQGHLGLGRSRGRGDRRMGGRRHDRCRIARSR